MCGPTVPLHPDDTSTGGEIGKGQGVPYTPHAPAGPRTEPRDTRSRPQPRYSHDHGYGHEEWNGNPQWTWRGFRVFHTEGTGKLLDAAQTGDLGMVMIASRGGAAYAMGIATNVYANADDEMELIADAVGVANEADHVWALPTVQGSFSSKAAFLAHWTPQCRWIRWKCPPDQYYWFSSPILLDPKRITGKQRLAMHHGRFTLTTPEVLLDITDAHLPNTWQAIRDWLSFGDFMQPMISAGASQISGAHRRSQIQRHRNAPTDRRFQYWVEGNMDCLRPRDY